MKKNKSRIIIWGCGDLGRRAIKAIYDWHLDCNIVALADNDPDKQGKNYFGYKVLSVEEVISIENDIDAVVIAASKEQEIEELLSSQLNVPIYKRSTFVFQRASIDITGWCNAKCKWCTTGSRNRIDSSNRIYMKLEDFKKIYRQLRNSNVIFPINELLLYNWGEPFLNPDYISILGFLNSEKQRFSLSTNASLVKCAENNEYQFCDTIIFSLSGFSQNSYCKMHGFNLERTKENIRKLIENMRTQGFKGTAKISFHVYKFNEEEVENAREFAESLDIEFSPVIAYLASWGMAIDYLKGSLSEELRNSMQEDLILSHVKELVKKRPKDYKCLLENMISINTAGQIELCCCCDNTAKNYTWGSVNNLTNYTSWKKLRSSMLKCQTCTECRELGIDYWVFNNPKYEREEML